MIIYKIWNTVNKKLYIGATRTALKDRWARHLYDCNRGCTMLLYRAMRKYGYINFHIESIDESATSEKELRDLETFYMKKYNTLDPDYGYNEECDNYMIQKDSNKTSITDADVFHIRKLYEKCEHGARYWYNKYYKDRLSFSGFEKIWEGTSWTHIFPEVYTEKRLDFYIHHKDVKGNVPLVPKKYTDAELLEMRKFFVDHTWKETWEKYGNGHVCHTAFGNILQGRLKDNVPVYRKRQKVWVYNGEKINIENYKPVSTISESGE